MGKNKVVVVMPAFNAASTLEKAVNYIPGGVVDDASNDNTAVIARQLGLTVIVHNRNMGYGANQKTCYDIALEHGADVVVMIHPDYQYDSSLLPLFTELIEKGICDVVLGSRVRTRKETCGSGMPLYKYLSNRFLTIVENIITGQNLSEWHTGYRAYSRKVLMTIPYQKNSNDFVFDSQFLIQAVYAGFIIGDLPVPCRYMEEASSINLKRSLVYGFRTINTLFQYILQRSHLARFRIFDFTWNE